MKRILYAHVKSGGAVILLDRDAANDSRVLAHEMGHVAAFLADCDCDYRKPDPKLLTRARRCGFDEHYCESNDGLMAECLACRMLELPLWPLLHNFCEPAFAEFTRRTGWQSRYFPGRLMDVKTMAKRGNKRMRKNRSRAESVAWPMMGGPKRKKDLDANSLEKFAMGVKLIAELSKRMKETKPPLPPEDGQVFAVLSSDPDYKQPGSFAPFTSGLENDWDGLVKAANFMKHLQLSIVAFVVCIRDREKNQCIVFPRPFIVSKPAAVQLLERIMVNIRKHAESQITTA